MVLSGAQLEFFAARGLNGGLLPPARQEPRHPLNTVPDNSRPTLLPSVGVSKAGELIREYSGNKQLDYDSPRNSRHALSEYLLNQHVQRRDEIRALVGVDLYA